MSDLPPTVETQAEKAEAASIRRRWITLGEVLAVVAVVISALTFWNSYRERADAEAERHAAARHADTKAASLVLKGAPAQNGDWLTLTALDPTQTIQDQKVSFPSKLLVDTVETTGEGRIEAAWFDTKLKRARNDAGRAEESVGDERLPVAIATRFFVDGAAHDDLAIYDIGYAIEGAFLKGKLVKLRGLSLIERATPERMQARLDALWAARIGR